MSYTTHARPYAKAAFENAKNEAQFDQWSVALSRLSAAVMDASGRDFITNPATQPEQQLELLLAVLAQQNIDSALTSLKNFIALLAENGRLLLLPDIYVLFEALRAEEEKMMRVTVRSSSPFSEKQEEALITSLGTRLKRRVSLDISIDPTLLGGAVITAGDLVIDGSVRGKINQLGTRLAV